MQVSGSSTAHNVTQSAARSMTGYIRSTNANGVSAHYFRTPVTLSDAVRFNRAVSLVAASDRAVCVSSVSANIVFSVRTRCVPEGGGGKETNETKKTNETKEAPAPRGTKRGREGGETSAPEVVRSGWIPKLFLRKTPPATAVSATAMNAIAGAKRAAEESEPRVVLDEEAWSAAAHCVAALDRLCSTDGARVVHQLAVSVNQQRGDLRLFAQCPKVIVLARVAAGLATPLADVLHAVPSTFRMDGLLSTYSPTSADPIGGALSARPTEEEATATSHGQPPLCVVIGLASAQPPGGGGGAAAAAERAAR
jgi:hypothetical protein